MAFNSLQNPFGGQVTNVDLDLAMLPNPATGDVRIKTNLPSIIQSIKTLLYTNNGERPFRPALGCSMQKLLFEQIDRVTTLQLQQEIAGTLTQYEPRINVTNIIVSQGSDPNGVNIQIEFTLTKSPNVISISLFLGRKR